MGLSSARSSRKFILREQSQAASVLPRHREANGGTTVVNGRVQGPGVPGSAMNRQLFPVRTQRIKVVSSLSTSLEQKQMISE